MEGNDCYKFSTIRNFIEVTGAEPVRVMMDIGVNVGLVTQLMKQYFPEASVYGFEPVPEYFEMARYNTAGCAGVHLYPRPVTSRHIYADDLAAQQYSTPPALRVWKALPEAGPGWGGGSMILNTDEASDEHRLSGFVNAGPPLRPWTLDRLVKVILRRERANQVDVLKMDCEGCEHSCLGCASKETLNAIRFIVGEYHNIERFFGVMRDKLFRTHKVSLIGDRALGAFFAERLDGRKNGILRWNKTGMLQPRPWLAPTAIEWHIFNDPYVLPEERRTHSLP